MRSNALPRVLALTLVPVLAGGPVVALSQNPVPTSQPKALVIFREDVKFGHNADHEKLEVGWPAAYAKAKSPLTYIAMTSMTGANEAWYITPVQSWQGWEDQLKFESSNAELSAELARLSKADAEHISTARPLHLAARPDLSHGTFPNVAKIRYYEIQWFRVRPGHDQEFERLARVFQAAYAKAAPKSPYRFYQVEAGAPGPTYVTFSSYEKLSELDAGAAVGAAVMAAISAKDLKALTAFSKEGMINTETQRFAMNGPMSYVDQATINQDPAFWRPKAAARKP